MEQPAKYRIESIDFLRGVVMILMALDHARMYFGHGFFFAEPTSLDTTTPLLYLTRWVTHFCAPVFVFLTGTAAFLYGTRKESIKEVSWFLFSRGIWLVLVEIIIVRFGWTFDITFSNITLQVIWAIGMSMIFLALLVFLPKWTILGIGVIIVFGHNILDYLVSPGYFNSTGTAEMSVRDFIYCALHQPKLFVLAPNIVVYVAYPLVPWIGLIALGYVFGTLYQKDYDLDKRKRLLLMTGIGSILLFLILRAFNIYGDPQPWMPQKSFVFTIMSFFNITKYPVSLLYLLVTLGAASIFLYLTENVKNGITNFIVVFGRVPFFFYVIHIYLIHLLAFIGIAFASRKASELILTATAFDTRQLANYGYDLWVVYLVWAVVIALLYPVCRWYSRYKANNRGKRWLSYL